MITLQDYFSDKPHPNEYNLNALTLLYRVNNLIAAYTTDTGKLPQINPITGSQVELRVFGGPEGELRPGPGSRR